MEGRWSAWFVVRSACRPGDGTPPDTRRGWAAGVRGRQRPNGSSPGTRYFTSLGLTAADRNLKGLVTDRVLAEQSSSAKELRQRALVGQPRHGVGERRPGILAA